MSKNRRLCVSLDGTWNNRDDSTNVLHGHSLMFECENFLWTDGSIITQKRFYQEGVGTGPLDGITGGGFGFGLEEHVRQAYNWLVQNFEDGDGTDASGPDEIYIFGFSRGAYTARSLVGFISMCGLLKRGAPMTVNQLWKNYCILGLDLEKQRGGIVDQIFGEPKLEFRRITDLLEDSWKIDREKQVPEGQVPGQRIPDLNPTERLLVRWSRRVQITYLGIYDTVGAMGWDALSIPGLRSKLAVHHHMRPTTLVQKCRHALAMDEHRSSFRPTPLVAYLGLITGATRSNEIPPDAPLGAQVGNTKMTVEAWIKKLKTWEDKIEQRWFVGAHSNIGGGYADNLLARRPLEWILEGARSQGLICEHLPGVETLTSQEPKPRDSFAEFAPPMWAIIFRAKRNFRAIMPLPELRANRDAATKTGEVTPGYSLININETVDESALSYWKDSDAIPPNLIECSSRLQPVYPALKSELEILGKTPAQNFWPGERFGDQFGFVAWAAVAAGGLAVMDRLFCARPSASIQLFLLCFVALTLPLIDWAENASNASLSKQGMKPWRLALLDTIYWIRLIGVVLFIAGLFGTISFLWRKGWGAPSLIEANQSILILVKICGLVVACAAAGVLLANGFNKTLGRNLKTKLKGIFAAAVAIIIAVPTVIWAAFLLDFMVSAAVQTSRTTSGPSPSEPDKVQIAGLLLLLELAFIYFLRAFIWVGEPTAKANLGSITALQMKYTPAGVKDCLDRWCKMLGDYHDPKSNACMMTGIIKQALWRDIFGFIPLYTMVMLLGLWFGAKQLGLETYWPPFGRFWYAIPAVCAAADYLEDFCHLRYLFLHGHARPVSRVLALFSFSMTQIKNVTFVLGMSFVVFVMLFALGEIAFAPQQFGWRGFWALFITSLTAVIVAALWVWGKLYKMVFSK